MFFHKNLCPLCILAVLTLWISISVHLSLTPSTSVFLQLSLFALFYLSLPWPISVCLDLSQVCVKPFKLTSIYVSLPQPTSTYLSLLHPISVYFNLSQFTSFYLKLPQPISVYFNLSQFTSLYLSLPQPISVYFNLCQFTLSISVYLGLSQFAWTYVCLPCAISVYFNLCQEGHHWFPCPPFNPLDCWGTISLSHWVSPQGNDKKYKLCLKLHCILLL